MYTLDAYSPVAGEVTIAQLAFKCEFLSRQNFIDINNLTVVSNHWLWSVGDNEFLDREFGTFPRPW